MQNNDMIPTNESEDEAEEGGGWLVSYADLMTLLFAAFVVLYGITPQGESSEVLGLASSIREAFIEIPDQISEEFRRSELFHGKKIFPVAKRDKNLNQAIKKFNRKTGSMRSEDLDLDELDILLNKASSGDGVQHSLKKATLNSRFEFGYKISLIDTAYFKPGSIQITAEAQKLLLRIGAILKKRNDQIFIEGHTESTPRSKIYSNLELGTKRASAVKKLWLDHLGLLESRIRITSYGDLRPKVSATKLNKSNPNNRVEIKIIFQ